MKGKAITMIPVKNMGRAVKFYKKIGFRVTMIEGSWWAQLKLGGQEFWLVHGSKPHKKVAYTAFSVRNIRKTVGELQKKGVKFEKATKDQWTKKVEGPIAWTDWGAMAFFWDSEGNMHMLSG